MVYIYLGWIYTFERNANMQDLIQGVVWYQTLSTLNPLERFWVAMSLAKKVSDGELAGLTLGHKTPNQVLDGRGAIDGDMNGTPRGYSSYHAILVDLHTSGKLWIVAKCRIAIIC